VTVKEQLLARVAEMDDEQAAETLRLLDLRPDLANTEGDDESLTAEDVVALEEGRAALAAGDVLSADEVRDLFA
jgi:hypothetical protein